jgi:putative transcriptional regulator
MARYAGKSGRRNERLVRPAGSVCAKPTVGERLAERLARFADGLQKADKLEDSFTCRTIRLNIAPRKCSPGRVKQARRQLRASQRVFASFLGVSVSAVRDWEQGLKPPGGAACRIMDEIRRDPDYWLARLRELSTSS